MRGLGRQQPVDPFDKLAWDAASTGSVELPVLREWTFTTAVSEDFESLIRRLKPFDDVAQAAGSTRSVSGGAPGYYSVRERVCPPRDRGSAASTGVPARHRADPDARFHAAARDDADACRPEPGAGSGRPRARRSGCRGSAPRVAGLRQALRATEQHRGKFRENPWVPRARSLDLHCRTAAGVGARIVKRHQERLVRLASHQLGTIRDANRLIARLEAANRVGARIIDRYIALLPARVALHVAESMLDLVAMPGTASRSIGTGLRRARIPERQPPACAAPDGCAPSRSGRKKHPASCRAFRGPWRRSDVARAGAARAWQEGRLGYAP